MKESNKFADVPIRIRSWIYIIDVFAIGLLHPFLTVCLFITLSAQGIREYLKLKKTDNRLFIFIPLLLLEFFCAYTNQYGLFIGAVICYCLTICLFNFNHRGIAFLSAIVVNIIALGHLPFIIHSTGSGNLWKSIAPLIYLIVLTECNDVFQYLSGKTFGKHKAFPTISPNKTCEGCIGGIFLTTILSMVLGKLLLPEFNLWIHAGLGVLISLLGLAGDLFISYQKRLAGVKDTGTLIPGHGGLLDRMDSLIFIAPVYYWILRFML